MRRLSRAVPMVGLALLLAAGAAPAAGVAVPTAGAAVSRGASQAPEEDHGAMPGMDAPEQTGAEGPDDPSTHEGHDAMPGMDMPADEMPAAPDGHAGDVSRPRGLVLGTFAGVNAVVLLAAAIVRRRTARGSGRRGHHGTTRAARADRTAAVGTA